MDKNTTIEFRDFVESNFVWVNRNYSFYFIQTKMTNLKDLKLEDVIYQKAYSNIIIWSSMEKTFNDQPVGSEMKRYREIRILTIRQGKDDTTGCLLEYDYIKIIID